MVSPLILQGINFLFGLYWSRYIAESNIMMHDSASSKLVKSPLKMLDLPHANGSGTTDEGPH